MRGSHIPRMAVSRETRPGSFSSSIRFHSPNLSHGAKVEPTFVSEPLESTTSALGVKSCGIASR